MCERERGEEEGRHAVLKELTGLRAIDTTQGALTASKCLIGLQIKTGLSLTYTASIFFLHSTVLSSAGADNLLCA